MLIVSGLTLNCCVFGALFRPLEDNYEDCDENEVTKPLKEDIPALPLSKSELIKLKPSLEINVTTSIEEEDEDIDKSWNEKENLKNGCISLANNLNEAVVEVKPKTRHSFSVHKVNESQNGDIFTNGLINATSLGSVEVSNPDCNVVKEVERRRSCSLSPNSGLLYRKDIFYSGSLLNIPHYRSNPDLISVTKKKPEKQCFLFRSLQCSEEMIDTFNEMLDFTLLRRAIFLIFAVSNFLTSIGFFVPHIYIKVSFLNSI